MRIFRSTIATLNLTCLAAWEWDGCPDLVDTDFEEVVIIGKTPVHSPTLLHPALHEPLELDFAVDDQGNIDIYYIERLGNVYRYDGGPDNSVTIIGNVEVFTEVEQGLVGIVMHALLVTVPI